VEDLDATIKYEQMRMNIKSQTESRISNFPVQALIIRGGDKNRVLAFGFPHPNEPIGSLVLEFLSHKLVTDREYS
jgi:hypothetical protein